MSIRGTYRRYIVHTVRRVVVVEDQGTREEVRTKSVELASERLAQASSVTFCLVSNAIVAESRKRRATPDWADPASCASGWMHRNVVRRI